MSDDLFLRAILTAPADPAPRLVYADWLEERGDPARAEYLRLGAEFVAIPDRAEVARGVRRRMCELRPRVPAAWLGLLADHHTSAAEPPPERIDRAAEALGRPASHVDAEGYERDIVAAATNALTGAVAYVESRSQQRGNFVDITYHLHVRDRSGREAAWEVETYNPYFGCRVEFLEWYGDAVLIIYEEKHRTYVCRFGLDTPAQFQPIEYAWKLDGRHVGYWGYREARVRRLSVPDLQALPPLSEEEAAGWDLLPRKSW
jgi:uncharacterized protein (TIGR02996 family)